MSEVYEHNQGDHEDPLPGPTWIVSIVGTVLLVVIILGVTALFFNADTREIDVKVMTQQYQQYQSLRNEQLAKISGSPRIVEVIENDRKIETIVIPIERAMALYASRAGQSASPTAP